MGRAPCCDKANVKKGPWSPDEDAKLKSYIEQHGTGGNWIALPQKIGLKRCGKSCRLRWLNYLRPNIKHGGFSEEEDNIICSLYVSIGSRWSVIAAQLPGRTDNDIKNYWNTRLKKKLLGKHRSKEQHHHHQHQQQGRNYRGKQGIGSNNNGGSSSRDSSSSLLIQENTSTQQHPPYWPPQHMPVLMPPLSLPPPSSSSYTNNNNQIQEPSFNDQDSIRKLLIKLGGRFTDGDYYQPSLDHQFPNGPCSASTQQQVYEEEQVVHVGSSSSSAAGAGGCMNNVVSIGSNNMDLLQFSEPNGLELVQGRGNSFSNAIGEMPLSTAANNNNNYVQRLDGTMEFLYGHEEEEEDMMMMVTSTTIMGTTNSCSQSTSNNNWDETGTTTMLYPSLVANSNLHHHHYTPPQPPPPPQECVFQHHHLSFPAPQ